MVIEDQQPKTEIHKKCKTVIIITHNAFSSASSTGFPKAKWGAQTYQYWRRPRRARNDVI